MPVEERTQYRAGEAMQAWLRYRERVPVSRFRARDYSKPLDSTPEGDQDLRPYLIVENAIITIGGTTDGNSFVRLFVAHLVGGGSFDTFDWRRGAGLICPPPGIERWMVSYMRRDWNRLVDAIEAEIDRSEALQDAGEQIA